MQLTSASTLHLAVTGYIVGLIWVIQLLHYPAFRDIAPERWASFHHNHISAMGLLAGPPMVLSLLLAGWCAWKLGDPFSYAALGCEVVAWVVTFSLSVPAHNRLASAADPQTIALLISTNWLRTAAWTIKLLILSVQRIH